ncbi:MAG: hypothetical protein IKZ49_03655 [Alphaproteobacteria bacterium]|nr:hypothetical protein [Alphaproteobacteria bacterium]
MSQYIEMLKKHKNKKQHFAMVTGKTSKSYITEKNDIITCVVLTLYDPKIKKEFNIRESRFGSEIMHTCSIGDIVEYVPQDGNFCPYITENLSHNQRKKIFLNAYNKVHGNLK